MRFLLLLASIFLLVTAGCESSDNRQPQPTPGNGGSTAQPAPKPVPTKPTPPSSRPKAGEEPKGSGPQLIDLDKLAELSQPAGKFTFYPGDVLEINIFEEPEFRDVLIRISSGMKINFPYAGEIDLRGMGIRDLEKELKKRLEEKMLTDAQVSVFLKTPAKRWVYTLGKLRHPQALEIPPMGFLCVADVISLSRGFAEEADQEVVEISRIVDGKMLEFLLKRSHFKTFYLMPGDKVRVREAQRVFVRGEVNEPGAFIVPEYGMTVEEALTRAKVKPDADLSRLIVERRQKGKTPVTYRGVALDFRLEPGDMVLATELRRVYVIGSVKKPGGYTIPAGGLRATMAVALAEGWTRLAAPNDTYVKRKMPDGTTRIFEVPLKDIMQGKDPDKNIELKPGDEVYVPESFF